MLCYNSMQHSIKQCRRVQPLHSVPCSELGATQRLLNFAENGGVGLAETQVYCHRSLKKTLNAKLHIFATLHRFAIRALQHKFDYFQHVLNLGAFSAAYFRVFSLLKLHVGILDTIIVLSQVSAWQSVTLLPISCKSVQPVPARVKEPNGHSKAICHEQPTVFQDALSQNGRVGCQNWHTMPVRIQVQAENMTNNNSTLKKGMAASALSAGEPDVGRTFCAKRKHTHMILQKCILHDDVRSTCSMAAKLLLQQL